MKFILQHIFENSMLSLVTFCCRLHRSACSHSNKSVANLEMCEIRVNTHTHSDRHSSRVNLLIFKKIRKDGNSFYRSFPPFSVFVCPLLSTFKLNDV